MGFAMDTSALARMLDEKQRRLYAAETYAQTAARELEAFAKADAPWTDRTGNARQGITGRAARSGEVIVITLSGSARYMVYLELAHKKRWAVLWPTIQRHSQRIVDEFARRLMS